MSDPYAVPRPPTSGEITSTIAVEDRVRGELHVGGCARVDGVLRGSIERSGGDWPRLVIGASGHVRGDIRVHSVWIEGQVVGSIEATGHVDIAPTARVAADISYGTLRIGAGARVDGQLRCPRAELRADEA